VVSKLALGQFVSHVSKPRNLPGHQIYAIPKFNRNEKDASLFGAGYTKYRAEIVFFSGLVLFQECVFVAVNP